MNVNKTLALSMLTLSVYAISLPSVADEAKYIAKAPIIDGVASESEWQTGEWYPLNQDLIGGLPEATDFSGSYTLRWDNDYLYLLARITDDVMYDQHPNPLHFYWDDDCLEIFIDEDASGGNHLFTYNAFAYHIALDNQAVDIGPKSSDGSMNFVLLNDHITSAWKRGSEPDHQITWEVAIKIFDDSYTDTGTHKPVSLTANKKLGFMLAYCDNDGSENRENFIGSHPIEPVNGDKNLGYIDASVFDSLTLVK